MQLEAVMSMAGQALPRCSQAYCCVLPATTAAAPDGTG
jgi:hypothetical protein